MALVLKSRMSTNAGHCVQLLHTDHISTITSLDLY